MAPIRKTLAEYSRQTTFRLILGGIFILFIIGDALIFYIYGSAAAISGVLCLGIGLLPVLIIIGILWVMEYIVKKNSDS
jgi:F0F1-type ATP synthase assembly protein I